MTEIATPISEDAEIIKDTFQKLKNVLGNTRNLLETIQKYFFPDEEVVSGNIYIVLKRNAENTLGAMYEKPSILMENICKRDASV